MRTVIPNRRPDRPLPDSMAGWPADDVLAEQEQANDQEPSGSEKHPDAFGQSDAAARQEQDDVR